MIACVSVGRGHGVWASIILSRVAFGVGRFGDLLSWGLELCDKCEAYDYHAWGCFIVVRWRPPSHFVPPHRWRRHD